MIPDIDPKLIAVVLSQVFVAFLAPMQLFVVFCHLRAVHTMKRWPTCVGTVVRAWVDQANAGKHIEPRVRYRYAVGGITHTSTTFWNISTYYEPDDEAAAERVIAPYAAGTTVKVSYNPACPGEAVVRANTAWVWAAFCVVMAVLDVAFAAQQSELRLSTWLGIDLVLAFLSLLAMFKLVEAAQKRRVFYGSA